ncbi:regulator of MON1-CCZ1 complex-like isoform X2 [Lineus longissimus]|uniref:regulator of MON1-CCZ1 complex-like isoform X2 n=1 Tax=Lineus longissimus TaxID=88925 RepID=UPI00315C79B0
MAEISQGGQFYIELCQNPIQFEPFSKVTNVFFDDSNRQVFCVRSGGATGVVVKGPDDKTNINFRMEDRGDVISVKFSSDMKILAVQRSQKSVEFVNFFDGMDTMEYSQSCKGKSTKIIGFSWVSANEIVFITDHGIEYYQVIPEKRNLRSMKAFSVPINWFVWLPKDAVLLLSSGPLGNIIHPFLFKGNVFRLPKFEVDLPLIPKPPRLCLLERDVTMAKIYDQLYIVVLRHQPRSASAGNIGAEIVLYQLQKESPARKTDVLRLDLSGRFAVNIVDNLILVHHQASKTSMMFDIKVEGQSDGYVTYHQAILAPTPIKPVKLSQQVVQPIGAPDVAEVSCELYSPNWIVFQPNIVIDAKLGCLWYVTLNLEPTAQMITDKKRLIDFLLQRKECKKLVLSVCKQMMLPGQQVALPVFAKVFDKLNKVYRNYLEAEAQAQTAETTGKQEAKRLSIPPQALIDQSDMYTHVFTVFVDNKEIYYKFTVAVLIEYIRSLNSHQIPVQHYLYELVINTLVQHGCYYQLHQFLQYHVLSDSKPIACLLLSLENFYPPAYQLALDMLKRLSTATEEIIEVLLSKQQLLQALRFVKSVGYVDGVSARKFLDAALGTKDIMIFYTVFKFFEQRNVRLRGTPKFPSGERCEKYVKHMEATFGSEALTAINPS